MSDQAITIRSLGPGDAAVLDRVAPGVFDNAIDADAVARFLAADTHHIVVALAGDLVVGMATGLVYHHPDKLPQFWVNEVGTGDGWLQRGVAARTLQALLDIAREQGCRYIWLGTESDNAAARGLYRKLGADEIEGLVIYEWDDEG